MAVPKKSKPMANPIQEFVPNALSILRWGPPSTVHQDAMNWRAGAKAPEMVAWTVTANTNPESNARKLPLPERMINRLAQPRVMIMPMPNMRPPNTAPEMLPCEPKCLELSGFNKPIEMAN